MQRAPWQALRPRLARRPRRPRRRPAARAAARFAPRTSQYELRQLENEFSTLKLQNRDLREQNRRHTEEAVFYK